MNKEKKYKCYFCKIILPEGALLDKMVCPQCNSSRNVKEMCLEDVEYCGHGIVEGLAYCPECGDAMCPICHCHNVEQISRITGYMSSVEGWNSGKRQELADRTRVSNAELLNK